MKKNTTIAIAVLFGASLLFSCTKETNFTPEENLPANEQEGNSPAENPGSDAVMVFSASLNDAVETKTYITTPEASGPNEGKYVPKWNSSDKIKVNGVQSAAGVRSADFTSASFSFSEEVTGPFYAIAPSADNRTWDAENTRYSIIVSGTGSPQVYRNYVDGSSDARGTNPTYDMSHAVLAAYSETTSLQFQQLTTYFKLTFTKGAGVASGTKIKTIYVRQGEAADTPNIGGSWRVSFDGSGVASITPGSLTAIIAYNCLKNGGTDIEGVDFGSPVIITLPSYNFEHGLIITVKDTEGHFQSFGIPAASSNLATKKGTLITKTLTYNPQSGTINSAEDWNAFAAAVNGETNDWDLYKWVGNGTVKLGADISASDLTKIENLKYVLDGQDHTITRSAATGALIGTIGGEVKNLTLAGAIDASASPQLGALADVLAAGAKISSVTNDMSITATAAADIAIGGIVRQIKGGAIEGCVNNGNIDANINVCDEIYACQVGGIVAGTSLTEDALLKDCTNNGTLTVTPSTDDNTNYVKFGALGGVIASISSAANKVTLNNCDNAGEINWIGAHDLGTSANNTKVGNGAATSIGGVLGRATPVSASYPYLFSTPSATNGMSIEMRNCDNSGNVNGKAIGWYNTVNKEMGTYNASTNVYEPYIGASTGTAAKQMHRKIYVGGLAGSLLGTESNPAVLTNCTNSGDVTPYDYATLGSNYGSSQSGLASVVGGLIGWGGYLDINGGSTSGTIGTKVRHAFALGGVIGFAVRPFSISDFTVNVTGYFVAGMKQYYDVKGEGSEVTTKLTSNNYAYIAATPAKLDGINLTCPPSVSGSKITNCTVSGSISTTKDITLSTTSTRSTETFTNRASDSSTNWVRGIGLTQGNAGVTID
ncbi:MAG: hypothetical protein IJ623_03470 [Bacteroidales bacterium]|nr:hypothetical protein [Bacteroidales bacterium]